MEGLDEDDAFAFRNRILVDWAKDVVFFKDSSAFSVFDKTFSLGSTVGSDGRRSMRTAVVTGPEKVRILALACPAWLGKEGWISMQRWISLEKISLVWTDLDIGRQPELKAEPELGLCAWVWSCRPSVVYGDDHGFNLTRRDGTQVIVDFGFVRMSKKEMKAWYRMVGMVQATFSICFTA